MKWSCQSSVLDCFLKYDKTIITLKNLKKVKILLYSYTIPIWKYQWENINEIIPKEIKCIKNKIVKHVNYIANDDMSCSLKSSIQTPKENT